MKMQIDRLIITNLPSFYKVNLYNRIAEHKKIFVVFTGDSASIRSGDFFDYKMDFEYVLLNDYVGIRKLVKAVNILYSVSYNELIISGYNELIYWIYAILSARRKNAVVVESSYLESTVKGLKGIIKKVFMFRVSKAYVSGEGQELLVRALGFKGEIVKTKGVGLFRLREQPMYQPRVSVRNFLYVGRLSPEKNLRTLILAFNKFPALQLNIIGSGPELAALQSIACSNIVFLGYQDNDILWKYYQENDVFVLPSYKEPWGLVVEEALNNGIPVIVSDKVGCIGEVVIHEFNGLIFNVESESNLEDTIDRMCDVAFYNQLRKNVSTMAFEAIAKEQVQSYLD